jgi:hypothetical protein
VLGSYVGTPEFITKNLRTYLQEVTDVASKLIEYPDYQGRMLLFRSCFVPKVYHIFRTTSPAYTTAFARGMEKLKKQILASLFDIQEKEFNSNLSVNDYSSHTEQYQLFNTKIADGGLGIQLYTEIQHTAYLASLTAFTKSKIGQSYNAQQKIIRYLQASQEDIDNRTHEDLKIPHLISFRKALYHVRPNNNITKMISAEEFNTDTSLAVFQFLMDEPIHKNEAGTTQSKLTDILATARINNILEPRNHTTNQVLVNVGNDKLNMIAWHTSVQHKETGMFLLAIPRLDGRFTMYNEHFRNSLRIRYQLPIHGYTAGMTCYCTSTKGEQVVSNLIDKCGHHLISGCKFTPARNDLHNTMVREMHSILKYCGLSNRMEDVRAFEHPVTKATISNHRPDITVTTPFYTTKRKLVLDITVKSIHNGVQFGTLRPTHQSVMGVRTPYRQATVALNAKHQKYNTEIFKDLPADAVQMVPIVFETTGAIHPDSQHLIMKAAEEAHYFRKIPAKTLYNFFLKRLSIAFQNAIGTTISHRMFLFHSHSGSAEPAPGFENQTIMQTFAR